MSSKSMCSLKAMLLVALVVAAMLAGNASAVEREHYAIIDYETHELSDEKIIRFRAYGLKVDSDLEFKCYGKIRHPRSSINGWLTFEEFEESYRITDDVDVKIRFDGAPHKVMKGTYLSFNDYDQLGDGLHHVFLELDSHSSRRDLLIREFLDKLIASDRFIARAEGSEILRFDLPAIRSKLVRFQEECRELQEGLIEQ